MSLPRKRAKPRKHRDVNLQAQYRAQWDVCELTPWLHRNIPRLCDTRDYSLELHHIIRFPGRYDFWSNLIRLSGTVHTWLTEQDQVSGKVLCLWRKQQKSELDFAEFKICSGKTLGGWLSFAGPPPEPLILPLYEELIEFAAKNEKQQGE